MWIITPENHAAELSKTSYLPLPLPPIPKLTAIADYHHLRERIESVFPDMPPESVHGMVWPIWRMLSEVSAEDIILVPRFAEKQYAAARATGKTEEYVNASGATSYCLPVRWLEKPIPFSFTDNIRLTPTPSGPWITALEDASLRDRIRTLLALPGQRFGKIKWLAGALLALNLVYLLLGALRQ